MGDDYPSWFRPDAHGANNWGGSNGGLQGRSQRRNNDKSCCFAGQAVKAVWMRKFKLARRFARLDVKTRLGII